jgi:hypothetical protein
VWDEVATEGAYSAGGGGSSDPRAVIRSAVMSYRTGPCTFCDHEGRSACPRCAAWVCASHDVGEGGHCAVCARELNEALEERKFARAVSHGVDENGMFSPHGLSRAPLEAVEHLADKVGGWFDEHGVRKAFKTRSREEIADWRRRAGVFSRER